MGNWRGTPADSAIEPAILAPPVWGDVATRLGRMLPARIVGLFAHRFAPGFSQGGRVVASIGIEPEAADAYARLAAQNPWFTALQRASAGEVMIGSDLVPAWELVRTSFYRAWLRPLHLQHALIGILLRDGNETLFLAALRAASQAPFGSADIKLLDLVLPALASATSSAAQLGSLRNLVGDLVGVLGLCPEAVMVVDRDGRPVILNPSAQTLLAQADGLALRHEALAAASGVETASLRGLIAAASAASGNGELAAAGTILISRPSGAPPLVLQVTKLPYPMANQSGGNAAVAAVLVRSPESVEVLDLLRQHYRMTPAEARLATLIATGCSLLQAAAQLQISHNTARTHMKRIYAKTDTRRQADLVRLFGAGGGAVH